MSRNSPDRIRESVLLVVDSEISTDEDVPHGRVLIRRR